MDYVVNDEKVQPGETILTSGEDRIFPKGLLIGRWISVKPASPFQIIRVQPAARLDRLEDVIVLLSQQQVICAKRSRNLPRPRPRLRRPQLPLRRAEPAAGGHRSHKSAAPRTVRWPTC